MRGDEDLYARGAATVLASWEEYTRGSEGAALRRLKGVSAAVFPRGPERTVYNNALFARDLGPRDRRAAVDAMEAAYSSAGVKRYAAWTHESDEGMCRELEARGYRIDQSTRAMAMSLHDLALVLPDAQLEELDWAEYVEYLRVAGAPPGLLSAADPNAFHVLAARAAGDFVATAIAFDLESDCGIFNMSHARDGPPARIGDRTHGSASPRRRRTWLLDRKPAGHPDGGAALRRGWFPRPRPLPRVRAVTIRPYKLGRQMRPRRIRLGVRA